MTGQEAGRLAAVLAAIAGTAGCQVLPSIGESFVAAADEAEPAHLRELRALTGGLVLHAGSEYSWTVSATPVPAGPVLLGGVVAARVRGESPDDLTNTCYSIATDKPGATTGFHVVMDFHPARSGRCSLATWDTFGLVGEMPVVATDLVGLLEWLLALGGGNPTDQLPALGDAYDRPQATRARDAAS